MSVSIEQIGEEMERAGGCCARCGSPLHHSDTCPEQASVTLRTLERRIAYESARADIECYCEASEPSDPRTCWYDTTLIVQGVDPEAVAVAVQYLDLRGLLKRHPGNPNLVRPLAA